MAGCGTWAWTFDVDAPALQPGHAWMPGWRNGIERIQKVRNPEDHVPGPIEALYLYGRSFFLRTSPIAAGARAGGEFFLKQARQLWLKVAHRQAQGHLALALQPLGREPKTAPLPGHPEIDARVFGHGR
jgi:hypothetical protein